MRLAHLTDLHLPIPTGVRPGELMNKRLLGYLSWKHKRQFRHSREALDCLVADVRREAPDFSAISGDLVNISLKSEFCNALQWLKNNFAEDASALTPGNHDAYTAMPWQDSAGVLAPYMAGERADDRVERRPRDATDFPFVRTVGGVALIFANSSPPTLPGLATGRLGAEQIDRIGHELDRAKSSRLCRVLVLHHPVTEGATSRRKGLEDAAALRKMLAEKGVELVLHGHTHRAVWASVVTPDGPRPVVGGASASHPIAHGDYRPARYNLFNIEGDAKEGWRIDVMVKELVPERGDVAIVERRTLLPVGA